MLKVRISIGLSSMVNGGDSFSTDFLGLPAATTIKVNTLLFCGFNFRGTRPIREKREILHRAKISRYNGTCCSSQNMKGWKEWRHTEASASSSLLQKNNRSFVHSYTHHVHYRACEKILGYDAKLFTLEMGSRGVPHLLGFEDLARDLGLYKRQLDGLLEELARHALAGSFSIWCARDKRP